MIDSVEGGKAYGIMYKWFTDVSGLGLLEQARRLMRPEPVKREEELADGIDQWLDKVKRLEAHGSQYKLPALYKVNALRMTGKAKEYFDLWEVDQDTADVEKAFRGPAGQGRRLRSTKEAR